MIKFQKFLRTNTKFRMLVYYLVVTVAVITGIPQYASAGTVPTDKSLEEGKVTENYDRQSDIDMIMAVLNSENGKITLKKMGITASQMKANLGKLNDSQLRIVAGKIKAQLPPGAGGAIVGVLVIALIVVLVFVFLDVTGLYKLPFRRGTP